MGVLEADRATDGSVRLTFIRPDGERVALSPDQNAFCLASLSFKLTDDVVLNRGDELNVPTFNLDGEALAKRLNWSEQRIKLVATELAELGIVQGINSEQPE